VPGFVAGAGLQSEGHMQRALTAGAAVSAVLLTFVAFADAQPAKADAPLEVTVTGALRNDLPQGPGSGTVVTEEEIGRAEPLDLGEILARVPGVQARQDTAGGMRLDISVRGLEGGRSRRVLVLEDGIPIALNPYAEPDLYYGPPIERVRAVELVQGSGNILFGPQTIGGVINFVTHAPVESNRLLLDAEGGSFGHMRGLIRGGESFGATRYVIQALGKRSDGFRGEGYAQGDAFSKIAFDTERTRSVLKIGVNDQAADSDAVGLTRSLYAKNPRTSSIAPFDRLHQRRFEVSLAHETRLGADTSLRSLLYGYTLARIWRRQNYSRDLPLDSRFERMVGDGVTPGDSIYFLPNDTVLDRTYDVAGIEETLEHKTRTGSIEHTWIVGARVLAEGAQYQQRRGDSPTSLAGALEFDERHRTLAFAGYAQERASVGRNLVATLGSRVEHAAFTRTLSRVVDAQGAHDVDISGSNGVTAWIPGLGLVLGTRTAHVFAGMNVGWAPPRITASVSPRGVPAELGKEQSTNYEFGARVLAGTWLKAQGTLHASVFQNQIVMTTNAGSVSSEIDAGRTEHHGIDAALVFRIGRGFHWPTSVDLRTNYSYLRAAFLGGPNAGRSLPYAPVHSGNATLEVEHGSGVGGEISLRFAGPQFSDVANTIAEDATGRVGQIDTHGTLDAGVHYRHAPSGLSVRVIAKNVTDHAYIVSRRPEGIFVGAPRQVMLGLRWEWEARIPE
jgi:Fe(3+) dicitrate transport protein